MARFLKTQDGKWINEDQVRRFEWNLRCDPERPEHKYGCYAAETKDGEVVWMDLDFDPAASNYVYVPGNSKAYVFFEGTRGPSYRRTTVVAWRFSPGYWRWPVPIFMDATDGEADSDSFVVVENRGGGFEHVGYRSFESLEDAAEEFGRSLKRKSG